MVALLDKTSFKQALKSPCCIHDLKKSSSNPSLNQNYDYKWPDLVALWVRAQRNNQAMRQLCLLFEMNSKAGESSATCLAVQGTGTRGTGKQLVNLAGGGGGGGGGGGHHKESHLEPPSIQAVFKGNPNYTRVRVAEISSLVDQLVEWAVVNQVLFTHQYIKEYLQAAPIRQKLKRKTLSDLYHHHDLPANKRVKRNNDVSSDAIRFSVLVNSMYTTNQLSKLKASCQAYVLRWFARRHRKVMTVLFSSHLDFLHLDIGCTKQDRQLAKTLKEILNSQIQEYLERPDVSDIKAYRSDRTLARIDRRLGLMGRYGDHISLFGQIETLLLALAEAVPEKMLQQSLIESAISDFREMHDHFFGQDKNVYETALDLVDTADTGSFEDTIETLKTAPRPWAEECCVTGCEEQQQDLKTCLNCERIYHEKCSPNHTSVVPLEELIRSYPPLTDLCKVKQPVGIPVPDFRGHKAVEWVLKVVEIDREVRQGGTVVPFGLNLRHTEDCATAFKRLTEETCLVSELTSIIEKDEASGRPVYPLAQDHKGCVIVGVCEGNYCGKQAGLQVGDIITDLELLNFVRLEDEARYKDFRKFSFKDLSKTERLDLLKLKTTRLRLKILRPKKDTDTVRTSFDWYKELKIRNKIGWTVFSKESLSQLFYCGNCLQNKQQIERGDPTAIVLRQAEYCRAVIRRLGMESYGIPFIDENDNCIDEASDLNFVSLRRLDAMMTHIMEHHSMEKPSLNFSGAFLAPPWATKQVQHCRRLAWAPEVLEKRPMELVCIGMGILCDTSKPKISDAHRQKQKALFRHFLLAFSSWCVAATVDSSESCSTKGPLGLSRFPRTPWFRPSCKNCCCRSCNENESTCDISLCSSVESGDKIQMDDIKKDEVVKISEAYREYSECASLVGTTLLVLPDDPLVTSVSKIVTIEHDNRPIEFIVASYLPPDFGLQFTSSRPKDNVDQYEDGTGYFHLLPVVSLRQLNFLLDRCKMRSPPTSLEKGNIVSWTRLDILELDGVARYSLVEVQKKILESTTIRHAIDKAVAHGCDNHTWHLNDAVVAGSRWTEDSRIESLPISSALRLTDPVTIHSCLIDTLIHGRDPPGIIRDMLSGAKDPVSNATFSSKASRWPIANPVGYLDEFGVSAPQAGLTFINPPIDKAQKILELEAAFERRCGIYYSDLHYENEERRQALEILVKPKQLEKPLFQDLRIDQDFIRTVLLSRSLEPESGPYDGIGWGLELLQWRGERVLRVGRVCRNSPAFLSDLRTNDIIIAIDGKEPFSFKNQAKMMTMMLGLSSARVRIKGSGDDVISTVLSTVLESKLPLNPVILRVYRPTSACQPANHLSSLTPASQVSPNNVTEIDHVGHSPVRTVEVDTRRGPPRVSHSPNARPFQVSGVLASQLDSRSVETPQADTQRTSGGRNQSRLENVLTLVQDTLRLRRLVYPADLYSPAMHGTILTKGEMSVFFECILNKKPLLGVRLLLPRYDVKVALEQIEIVREWSREKIISIPRLGNKMWWKLLEMDYKRSTSETEPESGAVLFREGGYEYRRPVDRLPIDRLLEQFIHKASKYGQQNSPEGPNLATHGGSLPPPAAFDNQRYYGQNQAYGDHHPTQMSYDENWPTQASAYAGNGQSVSLNVDNLNGMQAVPDPLFERIRGGGSSSAENSKDHEPSKDTCIPVCNIPVHKWKDLPVYSIVQTSNEGSIVGDATLVGFVKPPSSDDTVGKEIPEEVEVDAYYLSTLGYFDKAKIFELYSDEVWVVDQNSDTEPARVVAKLRSKKLGPNLADNVVREKVPCSMQKERILSFAKLLGDMKALGELPDGREVVWFSSDPSALFVRHEEKIVDGKYDRFNQHYLSTLSHQAVSDSTNPILRATRPNWHYCLWGCSVASGSTETDGNCRDALGFASYQELHKHNSDHHSFSSEIIDLGSSGRFARVSEGQLMNDLNADLTSAVCARFPSSSKDAIKEQVMLCTAPSGEKFSRSPTGQRLSFSFRDDFVNRLTEIQMPKTVCDLLHLWLRIGRLFEIGQTGLFRLTHGEFQGGVTQCAATIIPTENGDRHNHFGGTCHTSDCSMSKGCFDCTSCNLPWEKTVVWRTPKMTNSTDRIYRGIGCAPISEVSCSKKPPTDEIPGLLGEAKSLLLRIASNLPESLEVTDASGNLQVDPLAGQRIWKKGNFQNWRAFVMDASNPSMLAQALVAFLASIRKRGMPKWWRCDGGGWSSSQMLLASPNLSSLYLHLYVLDAAIAEVSASPGLEEISGKSENHGSLKQRIQQCMGEAEKLGFERFTGDHDDFCSFCKDGGSLLCCEFCETVQHGYCCDPQINSKDLDYWICDFCIHDIWTSKSK